MPVDIANTVITGGTSITVTDSSSRVLWKQDSAGRTTAPRLASGQPAFPLFLVGLGNTNTWLQPSNGDLAMNYTGGSGYRNVGGCYNTTNYRFTAPWDGMYLFSANGYAGGIDSNYTRWYRVMFAVNGSISTRRSGTPYRMRSYGLVGSYIDGYDEAEMIPLLAGDYVTCYWQNSGGRIYDSYSCWSGVYLGSY